MASVRRTPEGKWLARLRPVKGGRQVSRTFDRKVDAQRWVAEVTTAAAAGTYVDPHRERLTVRQWCEEWLEGYGGRESTRRSARTHVRLIVAGLGDHRLRDLRTSHVKAWLRQLEGEGRAPSYVSAVRSRLRTICQAAVDDGLLVRNPVIRGTATAAGAGRPYVATTGQVWALYAAFPEHLRSAVLLGAFAGLRAAEVVALRPEDVDWDRGIITPAIQYGGKPLKTAASHAPVPVPLSLLEHLRADMSAGEGMTVVPGHIGRGAAPWNITTSVVQHREKAGLPGEFRFHDLRHYFASTLIAAGLDVKTVQARVRHQSAKVTLDTYGHLFPDRDDHTRAALEGPLAAGVQFLCSERGEG